MAPTPSKMAKIEHHETKLRTNEERGFAEKFFFLNKSTTKYVIAGLAATTLEPQVKICDRISGNSIVIKLENFGGFLQILTNIVEGEYMLNQGYILAAERIAGIKTCAIGKDIWRLNPIDLPHSSLQIHRDTFRNLLRIEKLIFNHFKANDVESYKGFIDAVKSNTAEMTEYEIYEYLTDQLDKYQASSVEYQATSDLIANRDSFIKHGHFNEGFYNRNKIL